MKYNFYQLLQQNTIIVPLIQRDYAQGRNTEVVLRNSFVDKLKTVLETHSETLNLDFVYGYTENGVNNASVFIPLDGQQRLTTLWLLHWYFASKETKIQVDDKVIDSKNNKDILQKFTYETRVSAKRFCEGLVHNPLNNLDTIQSLSDEIRDASWFMASWNYDPTIISMLNMLDTIHERMNDQHNVWNKLVKDDKITFDYLDIKSEEFKLTDELYIKMNSRGKPLTDFENFKAQFSGLLASKNTNFQDETIDFNGKKVSYQQYFAFKIDSVWMDLFWSYRTKTDLKIDVTILNMIYFVAEFLYYKDNKEDNEKSFEKSFACLNDVFSKKENTLFLFSSLDFLSNLKDIERFFNDIFDSVKLFESHDKNLFWRAISDTNFDIKNKTLFYAILNYCIKTNTVTPDVKLKYFVRILRNLLLTVRQINASRRIEYMSNLRFQGISDYSKFIDDFIDLIQTKKQQHIYEIFAKSNLSGFTKDPISAEKIKAEVIFNSPIFCEHIHKLEDHPFIQGNTSNFILNSGSIIGKINAFCDIWNEQTDNSLRIRAFLTVDDYSVETHENSFFGRIKHFGSRNDWNRILTAADKKIGENLDDFLSRYLTAVGNTTTKKLNYLINNYNVKSKDWRYYFITYESMTEPYDTLNRLNLFTWGNNEGFSINGLGNSGKQPLHSYHLNPYLVCVKKHYEHNTKIEINPYRYTEESDLHIKNNMHNKIMIYCRDNHWVIQPIEPKGLNKKLIEKFKLEESKDVFYLSETLEKDKIEIIIDFIDDFMKL